MDLWYLMEIFQTETGPNSCQGYNVRRDAMIPYRVNGAQGGVGLGSQDQINGRGRDATCFQRKHVVIYNSVRMVPDG